MTDYLIRGARVLGGEPTDLLLRDGVFEEVGTGLSARDDFPDRQVCHGRRVYEARGLLTSACDGKRLLR